MVSLRFPDAVIVWLDPRRRDFGVKLVESVPEALCALHRHGLEEVIQGDQSELWKSAAGALELFPAVLRRDGGWCVDR